MGLQCRNPRVRDEQFCAAGTHEFAPPPSVDEHTKQLNHLTELREHELRDQGERFDARLREQDERFDARLREQDEAHAKETTALRDQVAQLTAEKPPRVKGGGAKRSADS